MNLTFFAAATFTDTLKDTADTFGWNWELFLSQVISFAIVAFLLRRFAYKPILAVLEDRRRKIEEGQLNAEEIRQLSREMLRASFTDGQFDRGKIGSLVQSLITKRPRRYIDILQHYKRLLRLEIEKRHARIESASQLSPQAAFDIGARLKRKYGEDLTTEFVVDPALLGGIRVRVGSDVWDGTLRNRLQRLQQVL